MNTSKQIIPNNLKEYRLKASLTQKQVAKLLELDCENRLSLWEQGKSEPSIKNLFRLAEIFRTSAEALYNV